MQNFILSVPPARASWYVQQILQATNFADHGPNATDASSTHGYCHGDRYAVQVCLGIQSLRNVSISDYFLH
jgi:hypothetical protein